MGYELTKIDTPKAIEMVRGAAQKKYVTLKEGAALYSIRNT